MKIKLSAASLIVFLIIVNIVPAQKLLPFKLPDTGQYSSFTNTKGEDCNYTINPPAFKDNGNGTVTDNNTGLMWQITDGGEMTFENAENYCKNLNLGGYSDWRLPSGIELFSINNYDNINPAINTKIFTKTQAEYWWTSDKSADTDIKIWVVNAGGGIGNHPKSETKSAGGTKLFHVRAVRSIFSTTFNLSHFSDHGNGTIRDNFTGLVWQKIQPADSMSWENALNYASNLTLAGKSDWRLPNVKELQSLNDPSLMKPSFNKNYFPNVKAGNFWSSTSMINNSKVAWDINVDFGIVSYSDKTRKEYVLCVRGGNDNIDLNLKEANLPGGEYEMGDHFGYVDPKHPSDELPVHKVKVDPFNMAVTEATNQQYLAFLNSAYLNGEIELKNNLVYQKGSGVVYFFTHEYAYYYSIGFDGKAFVIEDFRANHPVVGVMWSGAAAYCNWLSKQNGLDTCYNSSTWACDFSKMGYRLPTEAEWEFAAHGGYYKPYYNYEWGADPDIKKANWPGSNDPYEGKDSTIYPYTTPAGFYDGNLHKKTEFNWPGTMTEYQTSDGKNPYGLYDLAGNVWEFLNDWYSQNYYTSSPYDNPVGPDYDGAFIMPDGKKYRGMRGGNWYNGDKVNGIDDGHSRVSNRNPSYYRGPQDPNHPWYHVGFRVVRNVDTTTSVSEPNKSVKENFFNNLSPNPASDKVVISNLDPAIYLIIIRNSLGEAIQEITVIPGLKSTIEFNTSNLTNGIYFISFYQENQVLTNKLIIIK